MDDFLAPTLARQMEAELALVGGDAGPRLDMTSSVDPVTVFGAKVRLRCDRHLNGRQHPAFPYRAATVAAPWSPGHVVPPAP